MKTTLNTSYTIKNLELKNRIVMPPMCQYSVTAHDGTPTDWHLVHYASRAVGQTGLIIVEMTNVEPDGRITSDCLGLWDDEQIPAYKRLVDLIHANGSKAAIQIAHAGRKSTHIETPVSSSETPLEEATSFGPVRYPRALTTEEAEAMVEKYKESARRAVEAGFDTIEIHGAHGYLIHQFHSPGINKRTDKYGQDLALFGVEVIKAVKSVMPEDMPLLFRISAREYMDGGYGIEHALDLGRQYQAAGVDLFDISSGGEAPPGQDKPGNYPGYQVQFARRFKETLDVPVIAVGILDDPAVAEMTLQNESADLIAVGRGMLNNPYWAIHAVKALRDEIEVPKQYERGIH
ncbi:NADH:flavin oxidoreductase/NADH oxidase [Macrococcus hajekii]|uniref:NADH:flavin oxidoreductase/NADH oxidase n=1 Tax=Macrococcus hajekii TaxID=198482 RepID=A0A4V3BDU4_9STAP|nr:NADH:flavin oxidoreductase/NADH oxidase [Macrococcus hajekii]TDM01354.1 NADH:flavin oxidoreductase/NADH oxidase [Macrococcus hajekii]GGB10933.1 oxidoreductase [Macrococcus hajekii]